ncbi:CD151 antigen-like isoform X5 [Frankliniella occidentalis]|nr:CD151 antigen-like isoform X5 [Frankliniella occidentalis]XP_026279540.1 CD151 antigen-like isoform X5 [Frankliniella occidentalis]XP_026279541.1 CD151 antigen-like isoform X5 [Frankliniella occidentalis]
MSEHAKMMPRSPGGPSPSPRKPVDTACCGASFLAEFFHMFNLVFLLGGLAVLGVGVWTISDHLAYAPLLSTVTYAECAWVLALAGVLVVVTAVLGCVGVWRRNRCLLLGYTFLLLLIFLLEAMVGVLAYVYKENVETELAVNLNRTFMDFYSVDAAKTEAIDRMQREYKCCGAQTYEEWRLSAWMKSSARDKRSKVPNSCCKTETSSSGAPCGASDHPSNIPHTGCFHRLLEELRRQLEVLGAVGLGLSVIQVFGMLLSCALYIKLRGLVGGAGD